MTKPPSRRQIEAEHKRLDKELLSHLDAGETQQAIRLEPRYRDLSLRAKAPELLGYFLLDIGVAHYDKEAYGEVL